MSIQAFNTGLEYIPDFFTHFARLTHINFHVFEDIFLYEIPQTVHTIRVITNGGLITPIPCGSLHELKKMVPHLESLTADRLFFREKVTGKKNNNLMALLGGIELKRGESSVRVGIRPNRGSAVTASRPSLTLAYFDVASSIASTTPIIKRIKVLDLVFGKAEPIDREKFRQMLMKYPNVEKVECESTMVSMVDMLEVVSQVFPMLRELDINIKNLESLECVRNNFKGLRCLRNLCGSSIAENSMLKTFRSLPLLRKFDAMTYSDYCKKEFGIDE